MKPSANLTKSVVTFYGGRNTCFMNAFLAAFVHIPLPIKTEIWDALLLLEVPTNLKRLIWNILRERMKAFSVVHSNQLTGITNGSKLLGKMLWNVQSWSEIVQSRHKWTQEDAHELFMLVSSTLAMVGVNEFTITADKTITRQCSNSQCPKYTNKVTGTVHKETLSNWSLEVDDNFTFVNPLEEIRHEQNCETKEDGGCRPNHLTDKSNDVESQDRIANGIGSTTLTHRYTITQWPPCLWLHAKRFLMEGNTTTKLHNSINIQQHLQSDGCPSYRLHALILHEGNTPKSGHYTCYFCHPTTRQWVHVSDNTVRAVHTEFTPQEVDASTQAYLLVYLKDEDFPQ